MYKFGCYLTGLNKEITNGEHLLNLITCHDLQLAKSLDKYLDFINGKGVGDPYKSRSLVSKVFPHTRRSILKDDTVGTSYIRGI